MNSFLIFYSFIQGVCGFAMVFAGYFIWKNFKKDFENRTIGAILLLFSPPFIMIGARIPLLELGIISETISFNMFFAEYFFIALFAPLIFPRFFRVAFNSRIAQKIGLIMGTVFYLLFIFIHINQRAEIEIHNFLQGTIYEISFVLRMFISIMFVFFFLFILQRFTIYFLKWRKVKKVPLLLCSYFILITFFIIMVSVHFFRGIGDNIWMATLSYLFAFAGALFLHLVYSRKIIERENL